MTEATPELVGPLPTSGPTTRPLVKVYLSIDETDTDDDTEIDAVVEAVNDAVREFPTADRSRGLESWRPATVHGATMLAGRLKKRSGSPDGLAAFGDMGAVYVSRNDPDVALLLELGAYRKPAVG